jgi:ketopantoate reductase
MLDDPAELEKMGRLWKGAKVEIELAPNLLRARWAKLCWNMPFNGLTTILGTTCSRVVLLGFSGMEEARWLPAEWDKETKHCLGSS